MALSNDNKKDLLLQSFNILKNNISDNSRKINELISKMATLDLQTAIEMWQFVLNKGKKLVHDSDEAYNLCGGLAYSMGQSIGENAVIDIIENNDMIRKSVFKQSGDICCSTYCLVKTIIKRSNIQLANEIINYIYENKYKKQKFGVVLEQICEFDANNTELKEETVEMLVSWLDKVTNEEEKARIIVSLADYM